jgi:hypothetical protein
MICPACGRESVGASETNRANVYADEYAAFVAETLYPSWVEEVALAFARLGGADPLAQGAGLLSLGRRNLLHPPGEALLAATA